MSMCTLPCFTKSCKAVRPEGGAKNEKYEVMYIIRPNVEEEARKALIEEMNAVFTSKILL